MMTPTKRQVLKKEDQHLFTVLKHLAHLAASAARQSWEVHKLVPTNLLLS